VVILANDEFVDLDDMVPGTGLSKNKEDNVQKKETSNLKKEVIKKEVQPQTQDSPVQAAPKKEPEVKLKEETLKVQPKEKVVKEIKEIKSVKPAKSPVMVASTNPVKSVKDTKIEPKKSISSKSSSKKAKRKQLAKINSKEKVKEKSQKVKTGGKQPNWILIAIIIIGVAIIGIMVYFALNNKTLSSSQDSVVAVVNGEPLYKSELMNRYNLLRTTLDTSITEEQVLNVSITDMLLLQEASKRGISTQDQEVTVILNEIMVQNKIDEAALKSDLESKNVSYEYVFKLYKQTLTINKLMNSSFNNLTVSDDEIKKFYDENKNDLKKPDMVSIRHILIMFGTDSENVTFAKANDVLKLLKSDKSNFCTLVSEYSEDAGSVNSCGEYNFSMDYPFVPEFLSAGFEMKAGEVRLVKTQIGYHIIYKIADLPGYVPPIKEIKDKLESILIQEKTIEAYKVLVSNLEENAIIEIYSEGISTKRFKEISVAPKDTKSEQIVDVVANESNEIVIEPSVVPKETVVEPTKESSVEVTKQIVETPESQKMILANCLTDGGARMFTASWSPDSKTQLSYFEEYASSLTIVECDVQSNAANVELCSSVLKKQYPTWPTWQIKGELYEGIQSLGALSRYSGCPY